MKKEREFFPFWVTTIVGVVVVLMTVILFSPAKPAMPQEPESWGRPAGNPLLSPRRSGALASNEHSGFSILRRFIFIFLMLLCSYDLGF